MPIWVCPSCGRQFARTNQGHECAPAMSLEDYFSTGPPHERPIYDVVSAFVLTLGPVHIEPVAVGIFFKKARTFAELRPMTKWSALSFGLERKVQHRLIVRKPIAYSGKWYHVANLHSPADFDDRLEEWLTEAYEISPE